MDTQTIYLVGIISQATFALTLGILAWSDRRTRGTLWLAMACAIQFGYSAARSVTDGRATEHSGIASACTLLFLMYAIFVGLRWFVRQRGIWGRREPALLLAAMLFIAVVGYFQTPFAVGLGRCIAIVFCVVIIRMVWMPKVAALKIPSRITAIILILCMGIIATNLILTLPMEGALTTLHNSPAAVFLRIATIALITALSFSFVALFVAETNRRSNEETRTDSLTGLRNRRAMEEAAANAMNIARQTRTPLAVLLLDLDRFKDLNDTFGHALGDRALRSVGVVLMSETEPREITGRMGGEEFAVLLPGYSIDQAVEVAERLRLRVADLRLHEAEFSATLTVSIGVSEIRRTEATWTDTLCRADDALYRAKRAGRNRVEVVSNSVDTPVRDSAIRARRGKWPVPKTSL
ncbi:MAG: GGDEF domain-containing protein [Tepidiformaceae bacterium]